MLVLAALGLTFSALHECPRVIISLCIFRPLTARFFKISFLYQLLNELVWCLSSVPLPVVFKCFFHFVHFRRMTMAMAMMTIFFDDDDDD